MPFPLLKRPPPLVLFPLRTNFFNSQFSPLKHPLFSLSDTALNRGLFVMCGGSKSDLVPSNFVMEGEIHELNADKFSVLLELAASNDLVAFKSEVEEKGLDLAEASFWYGRRMGSRKMGFEERTPLVIAAMFGSVDVLKYILGSGKVNVNGACGTDGVTALHCAVAGGSNSSVEIVKLLLDESADANCVDANRNKPIDLIVQGLKSLSGARRKVIELLLQGEVVVGLDPKEESQKPVVPTKEGSEKKEYPIDVSLPDINDGIYGTDDFRMYSFKVKPCSRAYSHDWTECPFVHPGENARRRDPRKYPYTCVPCPEFRKGACPKGDACEYAHGVFESWLHPAQYRTRLCKDETGCARKVCFFAHKQEELRPVYASTGSAMPSPRSAVDMATLSTLALGSSSSLPLPTASTPPMSPLTATSPALQLPGSRLKTAFSSRDFDLEMQILGLENKLQGHQIRQNQLRASYPTNLPSPPVRNPSPYGFDSSAAVAAAVMNSRSSAFAKRSQSFIDHGRAGLNAPANSATIMSSNVSNWSSPGGKLDWGMQGDELNKLRKSASFGFRNNTLAATMMPSDVVDEWDVSWVNSLVKDVTPMGGRSMQQQYNISKGGRERLPPWVEQMYIEQEQMVA